MTWLLILLGLWMWWMSGYRHRKRLKQIAKELPTTIPAMPLVGQTYIYLGTDEDRMKALQRLGRDAIQQGGTIAYWQGQELTVGVADPVVADLLLKNCLQKYENIMRFTRAFTGNGSLAAPEIAKRLVDVTGDRRAGGFLAQRISIAIQRGNAASILGTMPQGPILDLVHIWRPRRKILSPIFSTKNLNAFVEVFAKQSATMVELLQPMVGAEDFSIWKYVATYTFDAVSETNFGVKMNSQKKVDHPFLGAFDSCSTFIGARMIQPWLYPDIVYRWLPSCRQLKSCVEYIDNFLAKIIKDKRKTLKEFSEKTDKDEPESTIRTLLELIMDAPGKDRKLNDVELLEETKVIISAGTDTSAVAACYTLLMLGRHPEIQEAVYEELREVFGTSRREVTAEDLPHLKYLEAVIKESLRLYPPVPAIVREITNDVKLPNGTTLTKGVGIVMFIWAVHRNPRYWGDDVNIFRPERFFEPLKHSAQFIPFSYGMRNCLGYQYAMLSLKTVLATLLRNFQVFPPSDLKPAHYKDPLRVKFSIMMKDVDNFVLRLGKRVSL